MLRWKTGNVCFGKFAPAGSKMSVDLIFNYFLRVRSKISCPQQFLQVHPFPSGAVSLPRSEPPS